MKLLFGVVAGLMVSAAAISCFAQSGGNQPRLLTEREAETLALTLSSPTAGAPLPPNLEAGCVERLSKPISFNTPNDTLTATWVSATEACKGATGAALIIWSPSGLGHDLPFRAFESELDTTLVGTGPYREQIRSHLEQWTGLPAFPASRLPPWREGELQPELPAGLKYAEGPGRDLYEAARRKGTPVFCWGRLSCVAAAPQRESAVLLLRVQPYQFGDRGSPAQALEQLIGPRK